jgi:acetyl esterase/lipase
MKATLALALLLLATPALAELPKDIPAAIPLWPGGAPGSEARRNEPEVMTGDNCTNVHNPSITPYIPASGKATGTAVIICPGGGHSKLCLGHEGFALAEWFRDRGLAAFVLKYRLSKEPGSTYTLEGHAMDDTRRAIRLIRSRAAEWNIRPDRLGILGFSAGGELAAYSAMKSDPGQKDAGDPIERQSSRPDFQALIYPGKSGTMTAQPGMPPVFIAAGYSDRPDISEGMAQLYLKYKAAKVPAELHIYSQAGHGFGYRHNAKPSAAARWPERFLEWLTDSSLLEPAAPPSPEGSPSTATSKETSALRSVSFTRNLPPITRPIEFHTPEADAILSSLQVFPPENAFNQRVDNWPTHPKSKEIVASIGVDKPLRYNTDMAFILVPPDQPRVDVQVVEYPDESDKGPFPIPDNIPIEGWPVSNQRDKSLPQTLAEVQRRPAKYEGDRHAIVVDPVNKKLYEFFTFGKTSTGWAAGQASIFDLSTGALRPEGWTSSDAAGLPIFPAIVRYDELQRGVINHAMRVTVRRSRKAYVHPATHYASRLTDEHLPRMGERLRLRADFDVTRFSPEVRTILTGLKQYGMLVADNGIEWAISTAPDPRIPVLHEELRKVKGADFEVVVAPRG